MKAFQQEADCRAHLNPAPLPFAPPATEKIRYLMDGPGNPPDVGVPLR